MLPVMSELTNFASFCNSMAFEPLIDRLSISTCHTIQYNISDPLALRYALYIMEINFSVRNHLSRLFKITFQRIRISLFFLIREPTWQQLRAEQHC